MVRLGITLGGTSVIFTSVDVNASIRLRVILRGIGVIFTDIDIKYCCFWLSIRLIFSLIDDISC